MLEATFDEVKLPVMKVPPSFLGWVPVAMLLLATLDDSKLPFMKMGPENGSLTLLFTVVFKLLATLDDTKLPSMWILVCSLGAVAVVVVVLTVCFPLLEG